MSQPCVRGAVQRPGGRFRSGAGQLAEAKEASLAAHNEQTALLVKEANGECSEVRLMMVHAQDHLMTGMLAYELIAEMIQMYKECQSQ